MCQLGNKIDKLCSVFRFDSKNSYTVAVNYSYLSTHPAEVMCPLRVEPPDYSGGHELPSGGVDTQGVGGGGDVAGVVTVGRPRLQVRSLRLHAVRGKRYQVLSPVHVFNCTVVKPGVEDFTELAHIKRK